MRVGIHLPNYPLERFTDADWALVEASRPGAVTTMAREHDRRVYDRIEAMAATWPYKPVYFVRFGEDASDEQGAWAAFVHALNTFPPALRLEDRVRWRFGNEWDKERGDLAWYCWLFNSLAKRTDEPLLLTNLSDLSRFPELLPAVLKSKGIAVSLYGQNADPEQLAPMLATGKPVYVVETGTLLYRGAERVEWFGWRFPQLKAAGVKALTVFIAGGEPGKNASGEDNWPRGYILTLEEAEGLGRVAQALFESGGDPVSNIYRFQNGLEVLDLRDELPRQRDAAGNLVKVPLRAMTALEGIAIHHSGAPVHKDFSALELATYHVVDRKDENGQPDPWPVIAYDWLAHWDGRKEYCKPWELVGYHVGGLNNYRWLAICAPGWWADGREPPQAQVAAVSDLIDAINFAFGRQFPIKPHSAISATSCPGVFYDRLMAYRAAKDKPAPQPVSEADLLRAELARERAAHKARLQAIETKATETVVLARAG